MTDVAAHPCPFPDSTVEAIASWLPPRTYPTVLDPFAGIGKIHLLHNHTTGIELEPEWANQIPETATPNSEQIVGSALSLEFDDNSFDAIATSPCFGNRMADHHNAHDDSARNTYKHKLGHDPSPGSASILHWGREYRLFHQKAWREATRVVRPNGRFILNIKNHIRKGEEQRVSEWHLTTLLRMGWKLNAIVLLETPGNRYGANHELRTSHEYLFVFDATWTKINRGGTDSFSP